MWEIDTFEEVSKYNHILKKEIHIFERENKQYLLNLQTVPLTFLELFGSNKQYEGKL